MMRMKAKAENYLMQVGPFVYDYRIEAGVEKVVVAQSTNTSLYSVYNVVNNKLKLAFTNMSDDEIKTYSRDLNNNLTLIVQTGRLDRK